MRRLWRCWLSLLWSIGSNIIASTPELLLPIFVTELFMDYIIIAVCSIISMIITNRVLMYQRRRRNSPSTAQDMSPHETRNVPQELQLKVFEKSKDLFSSHCHLTRTKKTKIIIQDDVISTPTLLSLVSIIIQHQPCRTISTISSRISQSVYSHPNTGVNKPKITTQ